MKTASISEYRCFLKNIVSIYQPKDGNTFCNIAIHSVACAFGVRGFFDDDMKRALMANEICARLKAGEIKGFSQFTGSLNRLSENYNHIESPYFIIAALKGNPHGHVCIVAPEKELVASGKWGGKLCPLVANVGATNFYGKGLNYAFGKEQPEIFVWVGQA